MCSFQNRNSKNLSLSKNLQIGQFTSYLPRTAKQRTKNYICWTCTAIVLLSELFVWWRSRCRCRRVLRKVRKRLDRTAEIQAMKSFFWKKVLHGTSCLLLQDRSWSIAHSTLEISFCFCHVEQYYIIFISCMLLKSTLEIANHPIALLSQWCSDIL